VAQIVGDTLNVPVADCGPLSQLCYVKTRGNPFFLNQFLNTLHERGLVSFDVRKGKWAWDMDAILAMQVTDNVVDLLLEKIRNLDEETQRILTLAASIGSRFSLETLALISKTPATKVSRALWQAMQEGLLTSRDAAQKLEKADQDQIWFRFAHDRFQQAAYALQSESAKKEVHLQLGRLLLETLDEERLEDSLFEIVSHLKIGVDLVSDPEERNRLVLLDLRAGKKAKASNAYQQAGDFFETALAMLPEDTWSRDYALTMELYREAIEAAYLRLDYDRMEATSQIALDSATELLDRVRIHQIRIQAAMSRSRSTDSVAIGLEALEALGVSIPFQPSEEEIGEAMAGLSARLAELDDQTVLDLPPMADPHKTAIMSIASDLLSAAYQGHPEVFPLLVDVLARTSLDHGNDVLSPFAFAVVGVLQSGIGDTEMGCRMSELSLKLLERYDAPQHRCKTLFAAGNSLFLWQGPLSDGVDFYLNAYRQGIETGDNLYAGFSLQAYFNVLFLSASISLSELDQKHLDIQPSLAKLGNQPIRDHLVIFHQVVRNLIEPEGARGVLHGSAMKVDEAMPRYQEANDLYSISLIYYHQMTLCYLFEDYAGALGNAEAASDYIPAMSGEMIYPLYFVYDSLIRLELAGDAEDDARAEILERVAVNQEMVGNWAEHAPRNYAHRHHLVEAERCRVADRPLEALEHYDAAAKLASENEVIPDEALANELLARFWKRRGREELAKLALSKARDLYRHWGAYAKVHDLEMRYPLLLLRRSDSGQARASDSVTTVYQELDLTSVLKASQAISGEIVLDELLEKIMRILMENAGAQRGYLILREQGQWMVRATGDAYPSECYTVRSEPLADVDLAESVVSYVAQTRESIILDDAANQGRFTTDPYIRRQGTRSLLCTPTLYQGRINGVLYLENNLNVAAFNADRLKVLQMLTSQAAISLENAGLYANLEQKVQERTRQLSKKNQQILSSIKYAKRIQEAMLPEIARIQRALPASFVILRPKDIVSGDFFWFSRKDGKFFIAVADCTGHGVPGAFMSMIGNTMLNQLINEERIYSPATVLEQLHIGIRKALRQENATASAADGMDISLCAIEAGTRTVTFAGARRPLYLVTRENGEKVLNEVRGDRKSIGGRQKEAMRTFTEHTVTLAEGDMVYLTTDGFIDQPDRTGKKYGVRKLKNVLIQISDHDVYAQRKALLDELSQWQGERLQRDDITVVGFGIKSGSEG